MSFDTDSFNIHNHFDLSPLIALISEQNMLLRRVEGLVEAQPRSQSIQPFTLQQIVEAIRTADADPAMWQPRQFYHGKPVPATFRSPESLPCPGRRHR